MSTRAMYQFRDDNGIYTVYKHHDGYPEGAACAFQKAMDFAWELPRFEADEFAAGFVAANKIGWKEFAKINKTDQRQFCGGGIRLVSGDEDIWKETLDLEYRYLVYMKGKTLWAEGWSIRHDCDSGEWKQKRIFKGTMAKFITDKLGTE